LIRPIREIRGFFFWFQLCRAMLIRGAEQVLIEDWRLFCFCHRPENRASLALRIGSVSPTHSNDGETADAKRSHY
jgi:hypothetical protein